MIQFKNVATLLILLTSIIFIQCQDKAERKTMEVTATAYNSIENQTRKGKIPITAWGDTLRPGMKCIAISRDLIDSGLTHNTEVKIEGLEGTYKVNDKMNKRWTKKIDIYMDKDLQKARNWGKKKVTISWEVDKTDKEKSGK